MNPNQSKSIFQRIFAVLILSLFFTNTILPPSYAQVAGQTFNLPVPGTMITQTPAFTPLLIKGITVHPENPLLFDFIVDKGQSGLEGAAMEEEVKRLVKYFLASVTIPEDEMWVNLSPYEGDRVIPNGLGQTEMGRDLLAQDYLLKQLTASLVYPEKELGKNFWDKVYKKAKSLYGSTDIPMNTFNKVWIVPENAIVYENAGSAFVINCHLKVMLEQDYLALANNMDNESTGLTEMKEHDAQKMNEAASEVVREVLLPEIEKEVNEGKTFANLRQMYNSMVLATWYKQALKDSLLAQVYMDKNKVRGVDVEDPDISNLCNEIGTPTSKENRECRGKQVSQKIYQQYLDAFKQGVYNYIKEDYDESTQEVVTKQYFSGGMKGLPVKELKVVKGILENQPQEVRQKIKTLVRDVYLTNNPINNPILQFRTQFLEVSKNTAYDFQTLLEGLQGLNEDQARDLFGGAQAGSIAKNRQIGDIEAAKRALSNFDSKTVLDTTNIFKRMTKFSPFVNNLTIELRSKDVTFSTDFGSLALTDGNRVWIEKRLVEAWDQADEKGKKAIEAIIVSELVNETFHEGDLSASLEKKFEEEVAAVRSQATTLSAMFSKKQISKQDAKDVLKSVVDLDKTGFDEMIDNLDDITTDTKSAEDFVRKHYQEYASLRGGSQSDSFNRARISGSEGERVAATVLDSDFKQLVQQRQKGLAGFHKNVDLTLVKPANEDAVLNWGKLSSFDREQLVQEEAEMFRNGKIGLIEMVGGEATRFGGPKTFVKVSDDLGEFLEIKAANLQWVHEKFGTKIPMFLLASEKRLNEFKDALEKRNYYGLDSNNFKWFTQGTVDTFIPSDQEIEANFKDSSEVIKHKAFANALRNANPDGIYRFKGEQRKVPAGHFDAIASFIISGRFSEALSQGIKVVPVFNIDNLQAVLKNQGVFAHFAKQKKAFGFILAEKNLAYTANHKSTGRTDKFFVRFRDNVISFDGIKEFIGEAEKDGVKYIIKDKAIQAIDLKTGQNIDIEYKIKPETGGTLVQPMDRQGRPSGKPTMKEGFELPLDFDHASAPFFNTNTIMVNLEEVLTLLNISPEELAQMSFDERSVLVREKLVNQIKPNFEFKNHEVDGEYPQWGIVKDGKTKILVSQLTRIMLQVVQIKGADIEYYYLSRNEVFAPVKEPEDKEIAAANNRDSLKSVTIYQKSNREPSSTNSKNYSFSPTDALGGIDLNAELLDLQIKRDGNGVPLPLPQQPISTMKIEGFVPIIINVAPVTNLPLLLGVANQDGLNDLGFMPDLKPKEQFTPTKAKDPQEDLVLSSSSY